jgi:hypothetical protein
LVSGAPLTTISTRKPGTLVRMAMTVSVEGSKLKSKSVAGEKQVHRAYSEGV